MLGKKVSINDGCLIGEITAIYDNSIVRVEGEEGSISFALDFNVNDIEIID